MRSAWPICLDFGLNPQFPWLLPQLLSGPVSCLAVSQSSSFPGVKAHCYFLPSVFGERMPWMNICSRIMAQPQLKAHWCPPSGISGYHVLPHELDSEALIFSSIEPDLTYASVLWGLVPHLSTWWDVPCNGTSAPFQLMTSSRGNVGPSSPASPTSAVLPCCSS
jgi:hypothetical protein